MKEWDLRLVERVEVKQWQSSKAPEKQLKL
jgi:hypothetical protein